VNEDDFTVLVAIMLNHVDLRTIGPQGEGFASYYVQEARELIEFYRTKLHQEEGEVAE